MNVVYLSCLFSAPFTIQRLCELMVEPRKNYSNSEKFMRGVEKVRAVIVSKVTFAWDWTGTVPTARFAWDRTGTVPN